MVGLIQHGTHLARLTECHRPFILPHHHPLNGVNKNLMKTTTFTFNKNEDYIEAKSNRGTALNNSDKNLDQKDY